MMNAGYYNKSIEIVQKIIDRDSEGFKNEVGEISIYKCWAKVKTTRGFTLIQNNTDFEKAYTNFTIRYPNKEITRDMFIKYNNNYYSIEYLNNIDEKSVELEIQAKLINK